MWGELKLQLYVCWLQGEEATDTIQDDVAVFQWKLIFRLRLGQESAFGLHAIR